MKKSVKKIITVVSLLMMLTTLACFTVSADTYYVYNDFKFKYLDDGSAMIAEYRGNSNTLVIPDTLLDHKVSSVEPNAFYQNTQIEYIEFGKNFNAISAMSFAESAVKEVNLPDTMTTLVWGAFSECSELTSVTIADSALTTIPRTCFYNCPKLTNVNLGNNITTIVDYAFSDCSSLTSVKIPKATTSIAANAFRNCSNLTLYVYKDSYAQQYAVENSINYEVIPEYEIGDVDLSGVLDIRDATLIQSYTADIKPLSDYQLTLADVNGDGTVNVSDATQIQRILAEIV